jgi:hypothetical protein
MPADRAEELADGFLAETARGDCRYFTNAADDSVSVMSSSWNPATPATFDRGVLVVSKEGSACFWVEDED